MQQTVTQEKQSTLSAAKDRAQLTATTAMSVVHVALLKSLVDGGPDANRWVGQIDANRWVGQIDANRWVGQIDANRWVGQIDANRWVGAMCSFSRP